MSRVVIPAVPLSAAQHGRVIFDKSVKESIETLRGNRGSRLEQLQSTASTAEMIGKINEIIARMQE